MDYSDDFRLERKVSARGVWPVGKSAEQTQKALGKTRTVNDD